MVSRLFDGPEDSSGCCIHMEWTRREYTRGVYTWSLVSIGTNQVALDTMRAFFIDKPPAQRYDTFVLDKIKLKKSVDFNR